MNFTSLVPSTILISTSISKHAVKIDVTFCTKFDGTLINISTALNTFCSIDPENNYDINR